VLDGGYRAWVAAGLPIETGAAAPTAPGTVELGWGALPTIDTDGAAQFPAAGVLLDARAPERFRGEVEPLDPRAGHVPGAVSAPTTGNLVETGEFLDPAALRERFAALGVGSDIPVAVYCGSGITASHQILALEVAGQAAALYPGSWSQWSNDDTREAAVGAG
jgi:thiosulfate/3-mercaptopyruvate sulfurtransferase